MVDISYSFGGLSLLDDQVSNSLTLPDDLVTGDRFWLIVHDDIYTKAIQVEVQSGDGDGFSLRVTDAKYDSGSVYDSINGDYEAIQDHFDTGGNQWTVATSVHTNGYGLHSVTLGGTSNGTDYIQPDTATYFPIIDSTQNILVNGSLASGVADGAWTTQSSIEGWTNQNGVVEVWGEGFNGITTSDADGIVELDVNSGGALDTLSQTVQTQAGSTYTLSFDAGQRGADSESVEVLWNGESLGTFQPDASTDWTTFEVSVTGTGGADTLTFRELSDENDGSGPLLNNISLSDQVGGDDLPSGLMTYSFGGTWISEDFAQHSIMLPDNLVSGDRFWVMAQDGGYTKAIEVEINDLGDGDFSLQTTGAKYDDNALYDTLNGDFQAIQDHFDNNGINSNIATNIDDAGYGLHSVTLGGASNGTDYVQPDSATQFDVNPEPVEPGEISDVTSMAVISHADDDLYFMNPDIRGSIEDGLGHVTVISTAGDAGADASHWVGREAGIKAAYSVMTGSDAWMDETVTLDNGSKTFEVHTSYLEDQPEVRLYFLRLPDGNPGGSGYGSTGYESVDQLWDGAISEINSIDGQNSYTANELTWVMTELMNMHQPEMVMIQDHDSQYVSSDHSDHVHTAEFAMQAQAAYDSPHVVRAYVEYATNGLPVNLDAETIQENTAVIEAYAQYDGVSTTSGWLSRQYSEELFNSLGGGEGDGAAPPEGAVNLLTNGDFATGDLSGWQAGNPSGNTGPTGEGGFVSFNANDEANYGDSIEQSFATEPGATLTVSMDLFEDNGGVANHSFRVDVLDANGDAIASRAYQVADGTTEHVNFSFTATTTETSLRITNISATDSVGTDAKVDNIWVYADPGDGGTGGPADGQTITGTEGADSLVGDTGDDVINGLAGNDTLRGGWGNDTITGGLGDDEIEGLYGDDQIDAGAGNDHVFGRDGNDVIEGHEGQDSLIGGIGNDTIFGGNDNDLLAGNQGDDELHGGDGNDLAFVGPDEDNDLIYLDAGNDMLDGLSSSSAIYAEGGTGNDQLTGGSANDTLLGQDDDDRLTGNGGDDSLDGGAGRDTINGGAGNDFIDLGAGDGQADQLIFSTGDGGDEVHNFVAPTDLGDGSYQGADQIDVSALLNASGDPVSTDDVIVSEVGGNAVLTFPGGEALTLMGISAVQVDSPAQLAAMGIPLADDGSGSGVTYSLEGEDTAYFEIDPQTGDVTLQSWFTPDYGQLWDADDDHIYEISVVGTAADGMEVSRDHLELVVNEDNSYIWQEGSGSGDTVSGGTDTVGGGGNVDGVSYALEGEDAGYFEVDADTGDLSLVDWFTPDYDQLWDADDDHVYEVSVVGTNADGTEASRSDLELVVNEDNSYIWQEGTGGADSGSGGTGEGIDTGPIEVSGPGAVEGVTYGLDGEDAAYFEVNSDTGDLSLINWFTPNYSQLWDNDDDHIYEVSVVGQNEDGSEASRSDLQLVVTETNEYYWQNSTGNSLDSEEPTGEELMAMLFTPMEQEDEISEEVDDTEFIGV
ncbi:DUF642 domain-containing protein [Phaeobacter italicus]|uniref:DUF642 domain-containing protein n=1 Tax=Phaeobacter italicus TaxID=481446 RepID=UPI001C93F620|nr:DUF642 domain-containing protein [Phaeobacter italicus]MBY5978666.1 DUF642 domain-containing protein [Phaeobacter italicus]